MGQAMGWILIGARKTTAPMARWPPGPPTISLFSRRAHQRDCGPMANKLGQLRVVPKPQREHVAGATETMASHHP